MEAAFGRLHNGGWVHTTVETAHNSGWGDKWLDKVNETLFLYFPSVSNTFHPLYPAIYRCLDTPPLAAMARIHLEPSGAIWRHPGGTQESPRHPEATRVPASIWRPDLIKRVSLSNGIQKFPGNVNFFAGF